MHLVFNKGSGKHDRMDVMREDVVSESIECPKQGIIPHDMVHYAVESMLHKRGFVGRVLEGEAATFQMQAEAESHPFFFRGVGTVHKSHLRILALVFLIPSPCWATVDVSPSWDSVAFTAGSFRVEAKATFPGYRMTELRVWIAGKRIPIPSSEYRQIVNPDLAKITVTDVTGAPGSAYIEIPFLVVEPGSSSALTDGGTWVFSLENNKFTHKRLEPARERPANGA